MDKRQEENIAKLAFGDLSEAQAAEVRAQAAANPDAARALDSYATLRDDLRRLRDVPPDQLSKERLRNAILTQGLNPKPVRSSFPWMWASTAGLAAVLAIAVMMRPTEQSKPETVAMNYPSLGSSDLIQPLNVDDQGLMSVNFNKDAAPVYDSEDAAAPQPEVVSSMPTEAMRTKSIPAGRSIRHLGVRNTSWEPDRGGLVRKQLPQDNLMLAKMNLPSQGPNLPSSQKSSDTLVLIGSDKDSTTGASSAVEVHQTQDVIVSS